MSCPTKAAPRARSMGAALLLADEEDVFVAGRLAGQERVAGLLRERLEILRRARIGRDDPQHLARGERRERLLGAQNGERAVEAACVELLVVVRCSHGGRLAGPD